MKHYKDIQNNLFSFDDEDFSFEIVQEDGSIIIGINPVVENKITDIGLLEITQSEYESFLDVNSIDMSKESLKLELSQFIASKLNTNVTLFGMSFIPTINNLAYMEAAIESPGNTANLVDSNDVIHIAKNEGDLRDLRDLIVATYTSLQIYRVNKTVEINNAMNEADINAVVIGADYV